MKLTEAVSDAELQTAEQIAREPEAAKEHAQALEDSHPLQIQRITDEAAAEIAAANNEARDSIQQAHAQLQVTEDDPKAAQFSAEEAEQQPEVAGQEAHAAQEQDQAAIRQAEAAPAEHHSQPAPQPQAGSQAEPAEQPEAPEPEIVPAPKGQEEENGPKKKPKARRSWLGSLVGPYNHSGLPSMHSCHVLCEMN